MTPEKMWNDFIQQYHINPSSNHSAWAFGGAPDKLANLVVKGIKTATCSAYDLYALDETEPLPQVGDYSIILNQQNEAVCIIQTTKLYIEKYKDVSSEHAYKEGEGDRTLAYWQKVHEEFFKEELSAYGLSFHEELPLLCEEFKVVYLPLLLRKSTLEDCKAMSEIANEGKALLKSKGINQWQRGTYPSLDLFKEDVEKGIGYVVVQGEEIVACCAITNTIEEDYNHLFDGKWISNDSYITIHRSATKASKRGQGLIGFLFEEAGKLALSQNIYSIKIDTHPENHSMQRALEKNGFIKCGRLILSSGDEAGDERFGYEKKLG